MDELTKNLLDTLDFMTQEFGPSPIRNLAVTPIPGGFGQGFQSRPAAAAGRALRRDLLFRATGDP